MQNHHYRLTCTAHVPSKNFHFVCWFAQQSLEVTAGPKYIGVEHVVTFTVQAGLADPLLYSLEWHCQVDSSDNDFP